MDFPQLDFHDYHRTLPERLAGGVGAMAAGAVARFGSLAFRLPEGDAYTYACRDGSLSVVPGDEAADTVIAIDRDCWEGIVHELETAPGLIYGGRVKCLRGQAINMVNWEPGLRAIYNGRAIFDPYDIQLADRDGARLDPERAFAPSSDTEDMAHFLRTCGYLFVRNVFEPDEIEAFLAESALLRTEARKGDKLSWWGRNADGDEVLCRVTRAGTKPRLATIPGDPRLLALVTLSDHPLAQRKREGEAPGVSVIWKNPRMTEGLSDIPWHRDCGMGGHAVMCPLLIASVFLTESRPESGDLRMMPGSWQGSMGYLDPAHPKAPRGASFQARPGDVSLHYGDVMHAAPPPTRDTGPFRVSAVTGYAHPGAHNHRGKGQYNDVLHRREDGQIEHLSKVAAESEGEDPL